jgi:hypothetical protein
MMHYSLCLLTRSTRRPGRRVTETGDDRHPDKQHQAHQKDCPKLALLFHRSVPPFPDFCGKDALPRFSLSLFRGFSERKLALVNWRV